MKFCPNCGAELKTEAKFCSACGTSIVVEATPPVEPASSEQSSSQQQDPVINQAKEASNAFKEAIAGKTNLVQRVINIITKPKQEWNVIAQEEPNAMKLIGGYALILALIPAISTFIALGIIGTSDIFGFSDRSITTGLAEGLKQYISTIIGIYLLSYVIDLLAPSFDSIKNFGKSLQLAVYSSTAMWVAGILLIIPGLKWLSVFAGLYSIYLIAVGLPILKGTPKEKVTGYVVLTILAMIGITLVLALILSALFGILFWGHIDKFGF